MRPRVTMSPSDVCHEVASPDMATRTKREPAGGAGAASCPKSALYTEPKHAAVPRVVTLQHTHTSPEPLSQDEQGAQRAKEAHPHTAAWNSANAVNRVVLGIEGAGFWLREAGISTTERRCSPAPANNDAGSPAQQLASNPTSWNSECARVREQEQRGRNTAGQGAAGLHFNEVGDARRNRQLIQRIVTLQQSNAQKIASEAALTQQRTPPDSSKTLQPSCNGE